MDKQTLDAIVKDLGNCDEDFEGGITDEVAFEIAESVLFDNPGMPAAIKKFYSATDAQGWLADRV